MSEVAIWLGLLVLLIVSNTVAWWRFGRRSIRRSLATIAVASAIVLGLAYIPLALTYKTYYTPTNAMSPTIRGRHYVGNCPNCGAQTVVSLIENPINRSRRPGETGICTSCLQVHPAQAVAPQEWAGDRILVRNLQQPRRWDIVVFRPPGNRESLYAMRLVGLPGESIEIKEGGIWIEGKRMTPPPAITTVRWFIPDQYGVTTDYASEGNPTQLGDDEYFFLGDNSPNSSDSRFFGPVPAKDVGGVVTAIYWPPSRARSLPLH